MLNKTGVDAVYKPKVFIGSSKANIAVANLMREGLIARRCGDVNVWNKATFSLNKAVLEDLLAALENIDFAVLIWTADDETKSKGTLHDSPRDNVVFETGLFMGAMGRSRAFIVFDNTADLKIPTDFAGITLAEYDGVVFKEDGRRAVKAACEIIANKIKESGRPEFSGNWRSRFVKNADLNHAEIVDDLQIVPSRDGILINSLASKIEPYSAYGRIYGNQVIGKWEHKSGKNFVDGTFMLVVNPRADVLYGYCTGRDERGGMIFATWVLAKKDGLEEEEITKNLGWGQGELRNHTMTLP